MLQQELAQLAAGAQASFDAQQKGFEVGRQGMAMGAAIGRALGLPVLHDGPIKQGKEGTGGGDKGIDWHRRAAMVHWSKRSEAGIIAQTDIVSLSKGGKKGGRKREK
jgi:hypothetical protein